MDNDEPCYNYIPCYGTLHIFNSDTCTPIIDIRGYIKFEEIGSHLLKVEQSDTKFAVRKNFILFICRVQWLITL